MTWVLKHSESRLGDRLVLFSIANHADHIGDRSWPSIDTIADETRMSPRQVQRAIQRLEELGELEVRRGAGPNGTHWYRLPKFAEMEARGDKLSPRRASRRGDKLSPRRDDKLSPPGGDKSDARGVTNRTEPMSEMSPEPSLEPSYEPSMSRARARDADDHAQFVRIMETYPRFSGRQNWIMAEARCVYLVDNGLATWQQLQDAVARYAAWVAAGGASSERYVMTPTTFFSAADDPWRQEWKLPDATGQSSSKPSLEQRVRAKAEEWLRQFDDAQPGAGAASGGGVEPLRRDLRGSVDEGSRRATATNADGRVGPVTVAADARELDARGAREGIQGADRAGQAIPAEPERVLRPLPAEARRGAVSGAADRSAEAVGAARGESRGP